MATDETAKLIPGYSLISMSSVRRLGGETTDQQALHSMAYPVTMAAATDDSLLPAASDKVNPIRIRRAILPMAQKKLQMT